MQNLFYKRLNAVSHWPFGKESICDGPIVICQCSEIPEIFKDCVVSLVTEDLSDGSQELKAVGCVLVKFFRLLK